MLRRRRATSDLTNVELYFIYFAHEERLRLPTDQRGGFSLLARKRVDYGFNGFEKNSGFMTVSCNNIREIGGCGFFY